VAFSIENNIKENWYALFLCVVKDITPDKAISSLCFKSPRKDYSKRAVKAENDKKIITYIDDPVKLIELKENHTYKEVAKLYGTYPDRIYRDIKNYKQQLLVNRVI
jgi:DNA invertase Pin-like site-specific DNA recombinase